jgi:hypothetical protein
MPFGAGCHPHHGHGGVFLTVTGVFLATRQWETFVSTVVSSSDLAGFPMYAVAPVLAKTPA